MKVWNLLNVPMPTQKFYEIISAMSALKNHKPKIYI